MWLVMMTTLQQRERHSGNVDAAFPAGLAALTSKEEPQTKGVHMHVVSARMAWWVVGARERAGEGTGRCLLGAASRGSGAKGTPRDETFICL